MRWPAGLQVHMMKTVLARLEERRAILALCRPARESLHGFGDRYYEISLKFSFYIRPEPDWIAFVRTRAPNTTKIVPALALGISLFLHAECRAGLSAVDVTPGGGQALFVGSGMIGWSFTANSNLTVTDLGYFDFGGDGLGEAHQVGIWDTGGLLLGSATVQSGDPLVGGFRYASTSGISLLAGQRYVVAGFQSDEADPFVVDGAALGGVASNPAITFGETRVSFVPIFSQPIPGSGGVNSAAVGPNLKFTETTTSVPVPEPGTALFGLALAGASAMHRRRSRAA